MEAASADDAYATDLRSSCMLTPEKRRMTSGGLDGTFYTSASMVDEYCAAIYRQNRLERETGSGELQ